MKRLVAVTTVVLIILLCSLGVIIIREGAGEGEGREMLADLKESLAQDKSEEADGSDTESENPEYYYDDALLRLNCQADRVTYEGRDFEVVFANPFYEEGSDKYISVIFYDETHGYLLRSLGAGTDSEFFEAYRTEDGCATWTKCASDIWFDLDGQNRIEMISETELVYVHTVVNENLGINETEISYSADFGDTWYAFEGNMGDEDSEEIFARIEAMSLEEKVAQLFIISPEALTGVETVYNAGDATYEALEEYPVGGIVYSEANIESSWQFENMIDNMQEYSEELTELPIFLAVAEEGGEDAVLGNNEWLGAADEPVNAMSEIGRSGTASDAYDAGTSIGKLLNSYGLNMNLAPVADVLSVSNPRMSSRTFGTDAQTVSDMAAEVVRGLKEQNIHAVLKYFPGYASASGTGFPVNNSTLEELREKEFLPYINAIEQGIDFIMVGHIAVPSVTGDQTPASMSGKMIQDVLRGELGFQGVVMTDALNESSVQDAYSSGEAAVAAIQAGADMLLLPADFEAAYEGVLDAVEDGEISEERIDDSLYRILRVKLAMNEVDSEEE